MPAVCGRAKRDAGKFVKLIAGAASFGLRISFLCSWQDRTMTHSNLAAWLTDERLPRYTSYPTAPHFTGAITSDTYGNWLAGVTPGRRGSLYLQVPFCRSMCWYCGCHTTITRLDAPVADYVAVLRREIDLLSGNVVSDLPIHHLHFGGGTPTVMKPDAFIALVALLKDRFPFAADAEIAVEIDPRTLAGEMVSALAAAGVTRASLGVQSLDLEVQRAVNRVQDFECVARASDSLRSAGIKGLNFDLIYGLPHESVASCVDTALQCVALRPERLAVFGYAHVPRFKKHQRKIDEAMLADGSGRMAQADAIADVLTQAGYRRIGFDHFALPDDPLSRARTSGRLHRNFQGYTTDPADVLIGLGASAIGRLPQGYVQNEVALRGYAARIARGEFATVKGYALTADDRLRADVIERLMCEFRVDLGEVCRRHGRPADFLLSGNRELLELAASGLVRIEGTVVAVAEDAPFLVRKTASTFDAYLRGSERSYSRAV
jgi:oxygen-independent coproporphyrinogen-3 oxidase